MFGDPLEQFDYLDSQREKELENRPCCEICGSRIESEEAYKIPQYGYICPRCIEDCREEL